MASQTIRIKGDSFSLFSCELKFCVRGKMLPFFRLHRCSMTIFAASSRFNAVIVWICIGILVWSRLYFLCVCALYFMQNEWMNDSVFLIIKSSFFLLLFHPPVKMVCKIVLTAFVCFSLHRMFHLQAIECYYHTRTINSNWLNPWTNPCECMRFHLHWATAIVRMLIHETRSLANFLFCCHIKRCGQKIITNEIWAKFSSKMNFEIFANMSTFLQIFKGIK